MLDENVFSLIFRADLFADATDDDDDDDDDDVKESDSIKSILIDSTLNCLWF